jgi:hypothetical protein
MLLLAAWQLALPLVQLLQQAVHWVEMTVR